MSVEYKINFKNKHPYSFIIKTYNQDINWNKKWLHQIYEKFDEGFYYNKKIIYGSSYFMEKYGEEVEVSHYINYFYFKTKSSAVLFKLLYLEEFWSRYSK